MLQSVMEIPNRFRLQKHSNTLNNKTTQTPAVLERLLKARSLWPMMNSPRT